MDDNPYRPPISPPSNPTLPVLWKVVAFIVISVVSLPLACVVGVGVMAKIEGAFVAHERSKHQGAHRDADDLASWQRDVSLYGTIGGFAVTAIGMPVMIYWAVLRSGILLAFVASVQRKNK